MSEKVAQRQTMMNGPATTIKLTSTDTMWSNPFGHHFSSSVSTQLSHCSLANLALTSTEDYLQMPWPTERKAEGSKRVVVNALPSKLGKVAHKMVEIAEEKGRKAKRATANAKRKPVPRPRTLLNRFVPITQWLPKYRWHQSFFVDLCAGLTAAVFSIPTGIAHAGICGVAPVFGLYTVIFPTFFYMFFGHSRHNSLGGFAILSLMTRAAIERVDRQLVDDMSSAMNKNNVSFVTNASLLPPVNTVDIASDPLAQQLLNDSWQPDSNDKMADDFALSNETVALMNGTHNGDDVGVEPELLVVVADADEGSLNTSLIIAELNVSADDNGLGPSSTSNPLLNDPIQLSAANTAAAINGSGQIGEIGKRLREIRPIHIATLILFLSGIFQMLMGLFRLDFLSCYFSEQVMSGFVLGGCVHVFFSQIGDLLGIQHLLPARSGRGHLYNRIMDIYEHAALANSQTVLISGSSIFFLLFTQQLFEPWLADAFEFPIPYELLLVIVGITATNFADLSTRHNITVVGNIPTNFPAPSLPRFELVPFVFFDAVSIAVTAVAIHLTVVKIVENRYHYKINSCKELYSLGLSGICSSAFPVFPITSIFARTLIGDANEHSTQMTTFFSSLSLLTVILYIGPALEYLPKCILASIVIVSACHSFSKFSELRDLWPLFKIDFAIFCVSFLLTVCYDMAEGLTLSALFSAFTIVVRDQWPKWHFLSHDEELNEYKEVPKQLLQQVADEGRHAFIIRYDAPLIFTSVHKFMKVLLQSVKRWDQATLCKKCCSAAVSSTDLMPSSQHHQPSAAENTLIIDCSGFPYVDCLGLRTLKKVYKEFSEDRNVVVKFAAPKVHLMRMFRETDFFDVVPLQNVFPTVKQAVNSCHPPLVEKNDQGLVVIVGGGDDNLLADSEEEGEENFSGNLKFY